MKEVFRRSSFIFILLFILSISFINGSEDRWGFRFSQLFEPWVKRILDFIHPEKEWVSKVYSDSSGMYVYIFLMAMIALFIGVNWFLLKSKKMASLSRLTNIVLAYYISFVLLIYGFNKIGGWQFQFPKDHILYMRLGDLPKDLLFWNTMGTSKLYNVFTGGIEVLAGMALLFPRTRILGFLMSAGIFIQVVFINFSFDISVKLFSTFLFLFSIYGLLERNKFMELHLFKIATAKDSSGNLFSYRYANLRALTILIAAGLTLSMSIKPQIENVTYEKRQGESYPFDGAYKIINPLGSEEKPASSTRYLRLFIHEHQTLILENKWGEMTPYKVHLNEAEKTMIMKSEEGYLKWEYSLKNGTISRFESTTVTYNLEKIDTSTMRLKEDDFQWTMDP